MQDGKNMSLRRRSTWPLLVGAWLPLVPCCGAFLGTVSASGSEPHAAAPTAQCYLLAIEGMTCKECAEHVQKALATVPGVAEAHVNFTKAEAMVCTKRGAEVSVQTLIEAVSKAGYKARLKKQS